MTSSPSINKYNRIYLLIFKYYGLATLLLLALISGPFLLSFLTFTPIALFFYGVFCFPPAIVLLISMFPRIKKRKRNGVVLDRRRYAELYHSVDKIVSECGRKNDIDIYVNLEANASVGIDKKGMKKNIALTLGLPLFELLTVSQLNAIIAHEIGHYFHQDIPFGFLTGKLLEQIHRSIVFLLKIRSPLFEPFLSYQDYFLKQISPFSKQQEMLSDIFSLSFEKKEHVIEALKFIYAIKDNYERYLNATFQTIEDTGHIPPILPHFKEICTFNRFRQITDETLADKLREVSNQVDSHPSLSERIKNIERAANAGNFSQSDRRAANLLLAGNCSKLEREVIAKIVKKKVPQISWQNILDNYFKPAWKQHIRKYQHILSDIKVSNLDDINTSYKYIYAIVELDSDHEITKENGRIILNHLVGSLIFFILEELEWTVEHAPGFFLVLRQHNDEIEPFELLQRLSTMQYDAQSWEDLVERHEIGEINLGQYVIS